MHIDRRFAIRRAPGLGLAIFVAIACASVVHGEDFPPLPSAGPGFPNGYRCKTAVALQEINVLSPRQEKALAILERAEQTEKEDVARLQVCQSTAIQQRKAPEVTCASAASAVESSHAAVARAEHEFEAILNRLRYLDNLPACSQNTQTAPTQPPPNPPPGGGSAPVGPPVTAPPVTTDCPTCQSLANQLNVATARYNQAVAQRDPNQSTYLQQIESYGRQLQECQKRCEAPTRPQYTPQPSAIPQPLPPPLRR